jgi:hypothetical protein
MRGKDDLFHLIKAMSKSEKRYFTLDAKKSGKEGAKYLNLFQTINGLDVYDEQKLKKKFNKNLSSDKGYLYEAILRSMRDYRSAKSRAAQIKERIMDSRYLYERGLYNQFEERLQEAKDMVMELDDNFALLEINKELQIAKHERKGHSSEYLSSLEDLNNEREKTINSVLEELKYLNLYFKLSIEVLKEFVLKDQSKIESIRQNIPEELVDDSYLPQSPRAQGRFLQCRALYYQLIGEGEKVHQNFEEVVNWWDKHEAIKEEEFFRYIIDVSNLLNNCFRQTEYKDKIPGLLEKLEQEKPSTLHEQATLFQKVYISKLLLHFNNEDFEDARELVPAIEDGLKKFNPKKELVLIGNVAVLFFILSDYENCLKWSDKIITSKSGKRKDIQRMMRLLNLISIYELGDVELLESRMRATVRHFKKVQLSKNSFEVSVLNQLKKIFNAPLGEVKNQIAELYSFLQEKEKTPNGSKPLGVDEFSIWAKRKVGLTLV